MENLINELGFALMKHIEVSEIEKGKATINDFDNILGFPQPVSLGKVNSVEIKQHDLSGHLRKIYSHEDGKQVGFGGNKMWYSTSIAEKYIKFKNLSELVDLEFVQTEVFKWALSIYKTHVANKNLITYLEEAIDAEIKLATFYIKVDPLGIEAPIAVGKCQLVPYVESYFMKGYDSVVDKENYTKEDYRKKFVEFNNSIFLKTSIKAAKSKALTIAKLEMELSINAIKCFLVAESIMAHYQIFDLEFLKNDKDVYTYIKEKADYSFYINKTRLQGVQPIILKQEKVEILNKMGLEKVSEFLNSKGTKSLDFYISNAINYLGRITSQRNYYQRIVSLISYFEYFINPNPSLRSKAEQKLKNHILKFFPEFNNESFKANIRRHFEIRDRYLHNSRELPIDVTEMGNMQIFALHILMYSISNRQNYSSVEQFCSSLSEI